MAIVRAAALARSRELEIQGIEFGRYSGTLVEDIAKAQQLNTPVILMSC